MLKFTEMLQPKRSVTIVQICFQLLRVSFLTVGQGTFPSDMPQLEKVSVGCTTDGMTVAVEFDKMFEGVIYAKGFYDSENCRFITPSSRPARSFTFRIPLAACGTLGQLEVLTSDQDMYLENTVIIQNDPYIQEVWDHARRLRCTWSHTLTKALIARPFETYKSFTVPVAFTQDTINTLMEVQVGKGPFSTPATGYLHVGDETSLVIYVQDPTNKFDAKMMGCKASNGKGLSVALTDENGCVMRPEMMTPFYKTRDTRDTGANIIMYTYFKAFKLPDTNHFYIRCNIAVCLEECNTHCTAEESNQTNRRRRSTEDNKIVTTQLFRGLTVLPKYDLEMALYDKTGEYCLPKAYFVASGSIGTIVLMSLTCVALIAWKKIKNYEVLLKKYKGISHENMRH
ncbi:cuticlin-3-like [Tachypleus tridentatus]|uniref:cuticlin-3-like n=1 Tax=Tachypleus tridentatus TaxID=6853 RepID=UPI003FD57674